MSEHEGRDLVGIGASAGGVHALLELLPHLPRDLPASVFLVIHRHPTAVSTLAELLARRCRLPVCEPGFGEPVRRGVVYLAPRDQHMTLDDGRVRLDRSPKQHHTRPAIDPLFRSLALAKHRAVGVLLSGTLADGVAGLIAIKHAGGVTLAQDPDEAPFPDLPLNAIGADDVDHVMRLEQIAVLLGSLARGTVAR